ncbi:diguanylate cyclase [Acidovorax sp. Root275]|uniref:GGDEF domain-containing protein n=1 Tax=unclassified Acidovorax TaxID=2684926 RepID=UPI00070C11DB|nr:MULTISPECIES: GGDEF domain-containing protein [unclassified Acidovorax]KRD16605.1 diguanylate cyclase [Acidovorax sp. Root267]KRD42429.1 diguanylate cyclase [Acidovorax sp. Root275]
MPLDFLTLMAVMAANLFMISAALPMIMGRDVGRAARHVQASMLLQAVAWAAIIASSTLWDQALSTVSIACNAAAQWMLYRALEEWLGPRPLRRVLLALVVLAPLGYTLGFGHYAWRVGWANGLMAVILCIVARATLYPRVLADGRWRALLLGCLLTSAAFTLARGLLGAFTDQYPSFRTPHPINLAAALATNVSLVLGTVAVLVAWRYEAEQKLRTLAMTDGLTGLLNRRGFTTQGGSLLAHAIRHQLPMTALMLDLDHFKRVNDTQGHEAGDRALQLFARLLGDTSRSGDLVGRLGGEEFGVLLLHNSAPAGLSFDRRLRRRLHAASVVELGFALDYSAGMAVMEPGESGLAELMARADGALYEAKTAGRGRLMAAS